MLKKRLIFANNNPESQDNRKWNTHKILERIGQDDEIMNFSLKIDEDMKYCLYTDGAAKNNSKSNPGPAGIGYVIRLLDKPSRIADKHFIGTATNNQAEYLALIKGLRVCISLGITQITAYSDSEVVVRQVNKQYRLKDEELSELEQEVDMLRGEFKYIIFESISRELNTEADKLSKEAITEQEKTQTPAKKRGRPSKATATPTSSKAPEGRSNGTKEESEEREKSKTGKQEPIDGNKQPRIDQVFRKARENDDWLTDEECDEIMKEKKLKDNRMDEELWKIPTTEDTIRENLRSEKMPEENKRSTMKEFNEVRTDLKDEKEKLNEFEQMDDNTRIQNEFLAKMKLARESGQEITEMRLATDLLYNKFLNQEQQITELRKLYVNAREAEQQMAELRELSMNTCRTVNNLEPTVTQLANYAKDLILPWKDQASDYITHLVNSVQALEEKSNGLIAAAWELMRRNDILAHEVVRANKENGDLKEQLKVQGEAIENMKGMENVLKELREEQRGFYIELHERIVQIEDRSKDGRLDKVGTDKNMAEKLAQELKGIKDLETAMNKLKKEQKTYCQDIEQKILEMEEACSAKHDERIKQCNNVQNSGQSNEQNKTFGPEKPKKKRIYCSRRGNGIVYLNEDEINEYKRENKWQYSGKIHKETSRQEREQYDDEEFEWDNEHVDGYRKVGRVSKQYHHENNQGYNKYDQKSNNHQRNGQNHKKYNYKRGESQPYQNYRDNQSKLKTYIKRGPQSTFRSQEENWNGSYNDKFYDRYTREEPNPQYRRNRGYKNVPQRAY